jgi:hypothetical protein
MSGDPRLAALAGLAQTLREAELAALRAAEARRQACAHALAALPPGAALDVEGPAGALLAAAQARWILAERTRCGSALAAATAEAMEARRSAARALGRAEALRRLVARGS